MKRKYKNRDLAGILNSVEQLGTFPLPGALSFAIVRGRNSLKKAIIQYNETCKQIGESRCEKDKEGMPISIYQKDEKGNELLNFPMQLKFKNPEIEEEAVFAAKKIGEEEIEMEVVEVEPGILDNLNTITPIQLEAILLLIQVKENYKRN